MNWLWKIILGINILSLASLLLSYYAPTINPKEVWIFSFLGLGYPILVIINLLFALIWLFKDMKYSLLNVICIAVGILHVGKYIRFNTGKADLGKDNLSVITFNIGNALEAYDKRSEIKKTKKERMNEFLERFKDEDIICLQEIGLFANEIIQKEFDNYNIHKFDKGAVIISKHRMVKKGQINFGTKTNSCLWADIAIDTDTIRVYSIHLQSNRITNEANKVIENKDLNDEQTWKSVKSILKKYKSHHIERTEQAQSVKEHADLSPYPVILCGDFNDVPMTYTYHLLSKNLNDAFREAGNGLGSTFNGRIPFLRIDYILHDARLTTKKYNRIKENYSDHYPIATLFGLENL